MWNETKRKKTQCPNIFILFKIWKHKFAEKVFLFGKKIPFLSPHTKELLDEIDQYNSGMDPTDRINNLTKEMVTLATKYTSNCSLWEA